MTRKPFARVLSASLILTAYLATPSFAGTPMRGYGTLQPVITPSNLPQLPGASAPLIPVTPRPAASATGRDRISLDRIRNGAQVGDSLLRLAPTTNNGHFTQFENYQGSISATTTVNGDNYGTVVTNQNGNILGLIGNNGVVDASALTGVDSQGK